MSYYGPGSVAGGYVMAVASAGGSSVLVSGAGTLEANGTYTPRGTETGKPYYNLVGEPDDPAVRAITGSSLSWQIRDDRGTASYGAAGNAAFPWQAAEWLAAGGDEPPPTVTEA